MSRRYSYANRTGKRRSVRSGFLRRLSTVLIAVLAFTSLNLPFSAVPSEAAYTRSETDIVYRIWDQDLESVIWYTAQYGTDLYDTGYEFDSWSSSIQAEYEDLLSAGDREMYQLSLDFQEENLEEVLQDWKDETDGEKSDAPDADDERISGKYVSYEEMTALPVYIEGNRDSILDDKALQIYVRIPEEDVIRDREGERYIQITGHEELIFFFPNAEEKGITYSVEIMNSMLGRFDGITTGTFEVGDYETAMKATASDAAAASPSNAAAVALSAVSDIAKATSSDAGTVVSVSGTTTATSSNASQLTATSSDATPSDATQGSVFQIYRLAAIVEYDDGIDVGVMAASAQLSDVTTYDSVNKETGGSGTMPYRIAGWLCICCAGAGLICRSRRNRRSERR